MSVRHITYIVYGLIAAVVLFLIGRAVPPRAAENRTGSPPSVPAEPRLCLAAQDGDTILVEELVRKGADVNGAGHRFGTPIELAAAAGKRGAVRVLLKHGADPNRYRFQSVLISAMWYMPDMTPEVIKHGANVNDERDTTTKSTPLAAAIRYHRPAIVKLLLKHGAQVNPPCKSPPKGGDLDNRIEPSVFSPLAMAVCYAPEFTDPLLHLGANIKPDKGTILVAAARAGRSDLIPRLLALGADPNGVVKDETPLSTAVTYARDAVPILLEHGARPDTIAFGGRTPLVQASIEGKVQVVRALLSHGAGVNVRATSGQTPLFYAREHKHAEVAALLEQAGGTE